MRSLAPLVLSFLKASSVAYAADAADTESNVISLSTDTFESFMSEHNLVLAEFFAPWCGHCKALAPKYEEAAIELKAKDIPLVKIDCTAEEDLCRSQGVEGYPTLKIFRGPNSSKPYQGARQAESSIVSYMVKQSLPAVSPVDGNNLEEMKIMDKIVVIGYFDSTDKTTHDIFETFAESQRDNYLFAAASDPAVAKAEGVQQPAVVLYKDFDEKKAVYDGEIDQEALLGWVKTASTPLVGEIGPETYSGYITAGIPLAYIFAETKEEREKFTEEFKPIAEKHKGSINVATIDAKMFGAHAGNLNLDPQTFPAFAIQDPAKNAKYPYDQSKELKADDVEKFIQNVLEGKIEPSIKSEPIPETQDGPVTVVVAHSYKELVIDNDKDVLVEFYAPWCGHCKALAPKYDELAGLYINNPDFAAKVTVAKIDATANDVPDPITGFPTIRLYPAGAKDSPVEYEGSRTVEDLAKFIFENGKHKVDAYTNAEQQQEDADVTTPPVAAPAEDETPEATKEGAVEHDEL
ncbi:protein disulfide isomerase PDI1 [Aspergillus homomorphus CBS 101889]|uniref:Protein disulfide-isomerase n=1 Tax=Aspergillus homomorphus (strain CBS 101889) TaxID=1450537 RepID=A0A395HI20_ASPHC|nr:protein disulfide isomerase A pdiA [Aspergillus homomorphus CBS 101889]RAL07562.1 protein disulfide isomerase A pdiA [Aspergillus homomorphus CBS 101889]